MTRKQIKKRYTKLTKNNSVYLISGNQSFIVNYSGTNLSRKEGLWWQDMLVTAIENILKEQEK